MDNVWVYHERQQALLCGLHALNNLCQAETFNREGLERIALRLEQQELSMLGDGAAAEYQRRLKEGFNNVDGSGNFSIQVLTVALQEQLGLVLTSISQV